MVGRQHGESAGSGMQDGGFGKDRQKPVRRGDIFWADIPETGGSVTMGKRPALVVQNNIGNRYGPTVIVTPVTSSLSKKRYPINVALPRDLLPRLSEVRVNQILTIDRNRLGSWIAHMPKQAMAQVDEALRVSLGLPRLEK